MYVCVCSFIAFVRGSLLIVLKKNNKKKVKQKHSPAKTNWTKTFHFIWILNFIINIYVCTYVFSIETFLWLTWTKFVLFFFSRKWKKVSILRFFVTDHDDDWRVSCALFAPIELMFFSDTDEAQGFFSLEKRKCFQALKTTRF